ncbi:hypothetical protein GMI69_05115 [Eggerthellaceae bacterium zg-887]|uniref:hypothetical protein n=1 Tax=Xiamenia xianingshaonis TaxID=2682776 RepID=UPI00140AC77F|nr:hypothetical protein [Xiamenia xianingshaonis]NHM16047.1 hypothetical protein [Xiamenia xianingshaonis]
MKDVDTFEAKLEAASRAIDGKTTGTAPAKDGKPAGRTLAAAVAVISLAIVATALFAWAAGAAGGGLLDKGTSPDDPVVGEWTSIMLTKHVGKEGVAAPGGVLEGATFSASEDGSCTLAMETGKMKFDWSLVNEIDKGTLGLYREYALEASGTQIGEFYLYMSPEADPWVLYLHLGNASHDMVFEKQ